MMIKQSLLCLSVLAIPLPSLAEEPRDFLDRYRLEARQADPAFSGFDGQRGRRFFDAPHGQDWSCSSCHTENPAATGTHVVTRKTIQPLAPAANPERFRQVAKVEKWFKRNCQDVLKRPCNAAEKGDVLTYLLSVGE
ncbi:MAG: DUF1924 domain-containing protein [Methylococcus sp.]|jgi:hypothetical protein|nr:MAG: DUF1924 domain-containing protein [Methylococcus sp.]